jgi:DUF971 family protein
MSEAKYPILEGLPAEALRPEHFAISKSSGIKIDWADGAASDFPLEYLRTKCPCASCTGAHGTPPQAPDFDNPLHLYREKLKINNVTPVGHYAIKIDWNDGHNTGIYSYDYLRSLHEQRTSSEEPA